MVNAGPFNDQARSIVAEALWIPTEEVPADASQSVMRKWDSLALVRIAVACEAAVGKDLTIDEVGTLTSVESIESILRKYLG